jgi:thiamine-phosphate pyrophosphorylase
VNWGAIKQKRNMKKNQQKNILRVLDANFNRAKEGMRVVEDIMRFINGDESCRKLARNIRHGLTKITKDKNLKNAIKERDSIGDPGKKTDKLEMSRASINDVLYANLQRAKESLRVLEEFFKIISPRNVAKLKQLRYNTYSLEKQIFTKQTT